MKILYVITRADLGGAQVHLLDLIRGVRDEFEVSVAVGERGYFTESLHEIGVDYDIVPDLVHPMRPLYDLRATRALRQLIRDLKPHLVHCHTSKAGIVGRVAAYTVGVPALFTAHTWCFAEQTSWKWKLIGTPVERIVARCTSAIINVSEANRRLALNHSVGSEASLYTIHNGIPDTSLRAHAGEDRDPVILMVARFVQQKNHEALLRAVAAANLQCQVVFAGDGPTRSQIEDLARELDVANRVTFVGERRDIASLMAGAHIFALPSNWEGFPLTILEAMRAGLPVVASAVGGVAEAVIDGTTGFVVPANDLDTFSDRLSRLTSNPVLRQLMGQNARKSFERRFTLNAMVQATSALYRRVVRANGDQLGNSARVVTMRS